jgi:hypothetical protein
MLTRRPEAPADARRIAGALQGFQHIMRRTLPILALLAATAAAVPASAQAQQARGVQIAPLRAAIADSGTLDVQLDRAREAGARTVRVEIEWWRLEPTAKGAWDQDHVALVDRLFDGLRRRGMKAVVVFLGTPCWASTQPGLDGCAGADPNRYALWPPSDAGDFGDAVGWLVARHGTRMAAIEVWNEPDHRSEDYLRGADKPKAYVALLRAAYRASKAANRSVPVLGGSLVGADGAFLRALYAAGMKGHYDGLAVHYYDLVLASLRNIRSVQRANGDSKPLWLTEFGWTSCSPRRTQEGHACVTRGRQAGNLADVFGALRRTRHVRGVLVYTLQDTRQYTFGLLTTRAARKPAFRTMRRILRSGPRSPRRVTLRVRRSGGRLVASGSAPAGDALELRAFRNGSLRYRATFRLNRHGRYRLRLPARLGTRGLAVQVEHYWTKRRTTRRV